MRRKNIWLTIFLLGMAASGASIAAGTHEGGHGKGAGQSAVGEPGQAAQVTRTVTVDLSDNMRFNPAQVTVKQGETIRFVVKNSGKIKHEMVLGTPQELREHYDVMMKMPGMEHAEPNQVVVDPGTG